MMLVSLLKIFFIGILFENVFCKFIHKPRFYVNERPIIGILSQENDFQSNEIYQNIKKSYIAASYVKYIESAGARVVPIWIGQPVSYYEKIMNKINGVLFPGGASFFNVSNGYADAAEIIYRIATDFNEKNDHFPLWGTCLGFEVLTYVAAKRYEHRVDCSSINKALSLQFVSDFKTSKLFNSISYDLIEVLMKENTTYNHHRYCVTKEGFTRANLANQFKIISLNNDSNNLEFISTIEHLKMPFFGVQFHPEKNAFEWVKGKNIPHTSNAIKVTHYFADFFVNEARKSKHKFCNESEENSALIYNYPVTYTGIKGSPFTECYLFSMNN